MASHSTWDPWHEMRRLQRDLGQVFERAERSAAAGEYPPINITHTPDGLIFVEALCPGADKDTLDVSVIGDALTIKGERAPEPEHNRARYHRRERVTGAFTRTVRLRERIDADRVDATYAHGILLVQLAHAPQATPKRITIRD